MLTKKDLESKFDLSTNTVYKTLQVCPLGTKKKEYTEEEIDQYFVPARQMLNAGKTYEEVAEYFNMKNPAGASTDVDGEEFNAEGFAANQATDATEAVGVAVAQTVADMVESGVKQVAPYIPALVMQTINQELNSGEIKQAFDNMRSQIKSSSNGNGSGAAFLLQKMQGQQSPNQLSGSKEQPLLEASAENLESNSNGSSES